MPHAARARAIVSGYPIQMYFTNGGTSAALGLAFKGMPDLAYDAELTEAQEDERILSLKRSLKNDRSSRGDSETQPGESIRFELDDPDSLAMKGGTTGRKTFFYMFAVLEYRDVAISAEKWWIMEICMMAETRKASRKCAGHNKIYLSD